MRSVIAYRPAQASTSESVFIFLLLQASSVVCQRRS